MRNRDKISPLVVIGICVLGVSILGLIFFTLGLTMGIIQTIFYVSYRWLFYSGIIAGGILLFLGVFYMLKSNKSKGILLITAGSILIVFILYILLPMIINVFINPANIMNLVITMGAFLVAPIILIIFGGKQLSVNVTIEDKKYNIKQV